MKKILKKSLSLFLTVLMVFSCFAMISPITAGALPATDYTYAKGDKYGTPAWSGTGDRWIQWATGSDYVKVYYPSQIYLDVSETLQSAGYHFDVEWHFGDSANYRILLGAPVWGDYSAYSKAGPYYYTMTNIFSDYKVDASIPPNATGGPYGATWTGSPTDYDLRIVGYNHANQGTDGFSYNNTRHDKYILWRNNVNAGNPVRTSIYLMGTPKASYKGTTNEFNTTQDSMNNYGLAQSYKSGGSWSTHNSSSMFNSKGSSSSYMEGQWIEMQWFVTVYDKSALNSEIVKAGEILSANRNYTQYVVAGSYSDLSQQNTDAQTAITTRATNQNTLDSVKNTLYNTSNALYFGASNTALRNLVAEAEGYINSADYTAKYTQSSRTALEAAVADAKNLSYYNNVPRYHAYNVTLAGENAASDQSAINSVANSLQAAINTLKNSTAYYTIKFNLADGTQKKLTYTYGFTIPSTSIPANTVKEADNTNHYTYAWDKAINYTVTGDAEYTEVLTTETHDWNDWYTTVYPSCTKEGAMYRTCKVCSYRQDDTIGTTAHTPLDPVISDEVPATCTTPGSYLSTVYCDVCGNMISSETVPVPTAAHTPGEKVKENVVPPSCTTDGNYDEVIRCTVCNTVISSKNVIVGAAHTNSEPYVQREESTCKSQGFVKTTVFCTECLEVLDEDIEYLPFADHTEGEAAMENEVKATCTEGGSYDMVTRCTECNEILDSEHFTTEAGDHDWGDWETVTAVSCTENGLEKRVCKNDASHVDENIIYTTGHLEGTPDEIEKVNATCDIDGYVVTVTKCTVCGEETERVRTVLTAPGHDFGDWYENKPATCEEEGEEKRECKNCVHFETKPIEKAEHKYESEVTPPSCTDDGYTTYTCSVCGDTYTDDEISNLGHTPDDAVIENIVEPDCDTDGSYDEVVYCLVCGEQISRENKVTPSKGHTEEEIPEVEATCTETGLTAGVKCSVCGEILTAQEETPALDHDMGAYVVTTPATCTTVGEERADCSRCDYFVTREIEKAAHTEEEIPEVEATCTETGLTAGVKCSVCGEILTAQEETPALDHDMGAYVVTTPATCTAVGEERADCSRCDYFETREIEKIAHTEEEIPTVEATCTETGLTAGVKCSVCGEILTEQEETPALDHDMGAYVVTTPATCTTVGEERADCSRCDYFETREIEKAAHAWADADCTKPSTCTVCGTTSGTAIGHDMGAYVVTTPATCTAVGEERADCSRCDYFVTREIAIAAHTEEEIPAVEATCTGTGLTAGVKCSVCGEILTAQEETPALDHDMGAYVVTTPATCTAVGEERADCSRCDYYETREIAIVAHTEEEIPEVAATCTGTGLTAGVKCSVCGEVLKAQEETPALDHDMGEYIQTSAPTCSAKGEERADCSRCDYFETKEIAKLAHTEETMPEKAPTCTETGLTEGTKCSVCGEVIVAQKTVGANGHTLGEWKEIKAPTCTEEGLEEAECIECDYTETRPIPEKEHEYDENGVCTECGEKETCRHLCHRQDNIFARIVWTIIRFFCSIFGTGRTCSCGAAHY